jgi:hypothetical protein
LYMSGEKAKEFQLFFSGGPLQTARLNAEVGQASALKMCYAAYTKGLSALLANILSLAENHQVKNELAARWEEDWPGFYDSSRNRILKAAEKAWRFEGEMKEISETFSEADLPDGFHQAASEIYARLGGYKNISQAPDFEHILKKILNGR